MDSKELLLYLEREKLKKEAIENSEKPIKNTSLSSKKTNQNVVNFDTDDTNVGSDDGKSSSSSSQISSTTLPITSDSSSGKSEAASFKNVPEIKASDSSTSVAPIKIVDDGVVKTSSSSSAKTGSGSSAVTVIKNFAIVKFTGPDNFGKSAYTIGKNAGARARKAIDYAAKDGELSKEQILKDSQQHLEYLSKEMVKDGSVNDDFRSGIWYDKNGNEASVAEAKLFFGDDITGERRMVYSPNPNLKMSDSEFQKVTNKVLLDFAKDYHKNFEYMYAIHRNTDNPHAHIQLKTNDADGRGIKMFKDELFEIKMRFDENTQAVAEAKQNMFTFFYKDETYLSTAMQIGRFTGDVPGAEFAKQNIYLAEKIAKKYNLEFDEKAMQKDTDKVKQFFEANKDKYNEFTTNAENRHANTYTKFSNDANALATKYNLGEVPKDMESFGEFLKQHEKLFLADKIATDKGLALTNKDAKKLSPNLEKDENGKLTKKGMDDFKGSTKWFDKNAERVREWNNENKNRMSKETYGRLENLNTRVDIPFEMPKDRMSAIQLNNHYKIDSMAFANDTRKALVDVVESRIKYFQKAAKSHEISKEEKKTNIERLGGLRDKIKAYNDITESSLKKYGIDTKFFSMDEKITELDGIKLEHGENRQKFDALLTKAKESPEFTPEQKDKIERISHVANKQQQVSVSALENAGFKREDLQKEFSIEKIETKQQIINFKRTDEFKELSNTSLKDWKQVNLDNYEFLSKARMAHMMADIEHSIKTNEMIKGKNIYLDRHIEYVNKNLTTLGKSIEYKWDISTELVLKAGIDARKAEMIAKNKDVEYIPKNSTNDVLMGLFNYKEEIFGKLSEKYNENSLSKGYFKATLELNAVETKNIDVFDKEMRNTEINVVKNPMSLNIDGETVSKSLFEAKNFTYDIIKNELSNEHGVEIKSAKDLSLNMDKIGTLNPIRGEFASILQLSIEANNELKGNDKFLNNYIDNVNKNIEKLSSKLIDGKDITVKDLEKAGVSANGIKTYEKAYKQDFLISSSENIEKLEFIKNYTSEDEFKELKESVQNGTMQVSTLNYLIADKTQDLKVVDINFKPAFDIENKLGQTVEVVKIDSLKNNELGETISTKLYDTGNYFNKIKEQISNEHGVEIKSAKDLSLNMDKIGTLNPIRGEFANKLELIKELNNELKSDSDFINKYIDTSNEQIDRLSQKLIDGKWIRADEFKAVISGADIDSYNVEQKTSYIENSTNNTKKLEIFFKDNTELFDNKTQEKLLEQLKSGELKSNSFNYLIANATQKEDSVDISFKPKFDIVEKNEQLEYIKICSLKDILNTKDIQENITDKVSKSEKFFNKIKNELSNEHGVEIKSAKELHNHFDKIGKASEFRQLLIDKTNQKIDEFKKNNGLEDDLKFEKFTDSIADKKSKLKDMSLEDKDQYKLSDTEKEYQGLNSLLNKNMRLKPVFESDFKKIDINGIDFKDFTKVNIEVDVIKNTSENKEALLSAFSKMMNKNSAKVNAYELNKTDKQALDKLFEDEKAKSKFKASANDYIDKAVDKNASKGYISLLAEAKGLNGFNYTVEKKENVSVQVNYLESRGISTDGFTITKEDVEVSAVAMSSKDNKEIFEKYTSIKNSNYELPKQKESEITLAKEDAAISDEIQQKSSHVNNFTHNRLSQAEMDSLRNATKEQLLYADPANVLNSLGIDFKSMRSSTQYSFRLRADDRTPSASMYLDRSGVWKFKDFGSGESGTIENVVMIATGMNYKDALNYSLDASGLKNYLAEAIESNQNMAKIQLTTEHLSRLEEIKNINIAKAQEDNVNSKVVSYREITPDDTKAIEFLSNRGIDSIPKNMYIIEGQISGVGANGKEYSYTNMGVGVLTGDMSKPIELDKVGADIHFLNPKVLRDGATMKTQSFGLKDMTLIPGENDTKDYAVFESKMDYAAAASKIDLNETNVIIANGTGQASKIAELLNEQGFEKVTFYNQNDMPGEKFVSDIVEKANIEKFDFVKYEAVGEYKQDINDLVKNGVDVEQRLISNATVEDWQNYILDNKEAKIEDIQSLIEKGELKQAEQHLKESGLDKETQAELRDDIEFAKTVSMISKAQEDTPEQEFETQQSEENQKVKDAALQEKALEDINLEKEQVRSSGMGM